MFPSTSLDYYLLGLLSALTFIFLVGLSFRFYYERQDEKEAKEYRERKEKDRQEAKIATILDLTNDIWTDVKSFKVNQK